MVRQRNKKDDEKQQDKPIEIEWVEIDPQRYEHTLVSKNFKGKNCDKPHCECNRFCIKIDKYGWTLAEFNAPKPMQGDSLLAILIEPLLAARPNIICVNAPLDHCKKVAQQILKEESEGE